MASFLPFEAFTGADLLTSAPPPSPPGAITTTAKSANVTQGSSVRVTLTSGDRAADGASLTALSITAPAPGRGTITQPSNNESVYTAPADWTGTLTLTYTVVSSTGAAATGQYSFVVRATDSPAEPTAQWWRAGWGAGATVEPKSGRAWNVGCMVATTAAVNNYLGFQQCIHGGKSFNIAEGTSKHRTDTWDKVIGGAYANGDGTIDDASQAAVHLHSSTKPWVRQSDGYTRANNAWGYFGLMPVPDFSPFSVVDEVRRGAHDDKLKRLGARIRTVVDRYRQDHTKALWRIGYEFNQNTALRFANGRGFFNHDAATLPQWREFNSRIISKLREGFGYAFKAALSPALQSTEVAARFNSGGAAGHIAYADLLCDEHDACCFSFHPNSNRCATETAARQLVTGTYRETGIKLYTPRDALDAAKASGRALACLEHNLSTQEPADYAGDLDHIWAAYEEFGKFARDNSDVFAFSCLLNSQMCNENWLATAHPSRSDAAKSNWTKLARTHRKWFGKKSLYGAGT